MIFRLSVRFLVLFIIVASCASHQESNKQNLDSNESEKTDEPNDVGNKNISVKWTWLPTEVSLQTPNTSIKGNEIIKIQRASKLWKKLKSGGKQERVNHYEKAFNRSWCFDLGYLKANKSPGKMKPADGCCKVHKESMSIAIHDNVCYKCSTEVAFYKCIKKANSSMSTSVGNYYFNFLSPHCYTVEEYRVCDGTICTLLMRISSRIVPQF